MLKMSDANKEHGDADEGLNLNRNFQEQLHGNIIEDIFIPIDELRINLLPANMRYTEIIKGIRVLKKLLVHISTPTTSDQRPPLVPDTNVPYPYFHCKGTSTLRTGIGRVLRVAKMKEPCNCKICDEPGAEKIIEYYHVAVVVPKYVIFDESEVTLSGCKITLSNPLGSHEIFFRMVTGSDIPGDWIMIWGCIHNIDLGRRLKYLLKKFEDLNKTFTKMCKRLNNLDDLTFVIRIKYNHLYEVAIGFWLDSNARENQDLLTMNIVKCFGPMGALIHRISWENDHPSYGPFNAELNHTSLKVHLR